MSAMGDARDRLERLAELRPFTARDLWIARLLLSDGNTLAALKREAHWTGELALGVLEEIEANVAQTDGVANDTRTTC